MNYYLFNSTYFCYNKLYTISNVIESSLDSNYILSGTSECYGDWKSYLLKINSSNGNIIWNKTYDMGDNDYINGVVEYNKHLFIYGNAAITRYTTVLINTDMLGNINWSNAYYSINSNTVNALSNQNNKLFLVGSVDGFYGNVSLTGSDSYSSEIDTNGLGLILIDSAVIINTDTFSSVEKFSDFFSDTIATLSIPVLLSDTTISAILDTSLCEPAFVNSYFINNEIDVFPNPNNGIFTVHSENQYTDITLYNTMGQEILKQKRFDSNVLIDISRFENGLYLLRISRDNMVITKKIIKE